MTRDGDFKARVRSRMNATGENYTTARSALLQRSAPAPTPPRSLDDPDAAYYTKTVRSFFDGRRLRSIPAKRRPRVVVLLELLRRFEPGRRYSEREVSAVLAEAYDDFAYLRRELVDYGYLSRDAYEFWVSDAVPERSVNEAQEVSGLERAVLASIHERPRQS